MREYAKASMATIAASGPDDDPILDELGQYPGDLELARIAHWPLPNFEALTDLLAYIRCRWRWPTYWRQRGRFHHVSTGGWTGHEEMLAALQENFIAWHLLFVSERRGGHLILEDRSLR